MRIVFIPEPPHDAAQRSDLVRLLRDRSVLAAALVVVLAAGGWGLLEPLVPVNLTRAGVSTGLIGLIFTIATVMYGVASPFVDRIAERYGLRPTMVFGLLMTAVTLGPGAG